MANKPRKQVLIVEDEPDAAEIYRELLEMEGITVDSASDGGKALTALESTDYDLVLLDIIMPEVDGVETLNQIKRHPNKYGTPKVVMLTNIGGDIAVDKAMELGADGYMLKSETEPEDFIGVVKKYLDLD